MKRKIVLLIALILAIGSVGFAQSRAKATAPNVIVKNLYAAHKAGSSPFFQTKNRALVDRYFTRNLADLIWKDAVTAKGEVGALDFDPLYGSQDPQITDFTIMETGWGGDSKFGPASEAVVQVTFKDSGKERMISFQFKQGKDKRWKIYDVHYRSDDGQIKLAEVLANATAASPAVPTAAHPSSKTETIEQLATALTEAFAAGDLGTLDADRPALGTLKLVYEHSISGDILTRNVRSFAKVEQWLKRRERADGPARNGGPLQRCRRGICTYEQAGMLHNNLYLQKITYVLRRGRPYVKAIYVIDGD
jgi:hypothetical protein